MPLDGEGLAVCVEPGVARCGDHRRWCVGEALCVEVVRDLYDLADRSPQGLRDHRITRDEARVLAVVLRQPRHDSVREYVSWVL